MEFARRRIRGDHPSEITVGELRAKHGAKPCWASLQAPSPLPPHSTPGAGHLAAGAPGQQGARFELRDVPVSDLPAQGRHPISSRLIFATRVSIDVSQSLRCAVVCLGSRAMTAGGGGGGGGVKEFACNPQSR